MYIPKEELGPGLLNRIIRVAAFQNPEFYKAQAMRLSTFKIPRIVACAEDHPKHIAVPRGCLDDIRHLFSDLKIELVIRDKRFSANLSPLNFKGIFARARYLQRKTWRPMTSEF